LVDRQRTDPLLFSPVPALVEQLSPAMCSASRRRQLLLKRLVDLVLAPTAVLVFLPLMVMAAIAVWATSPGPVLFRQTRLGLNGRPFTILKFRTLYTDRADPSGLRQACSNDDRVTPVGRFLRRSSIDELPQLFNVIRGEMSLVGPRPHVPGMLAAGTDYRVLAPDYARRLEMPPGVTGLAQAHGLRGSTDDVALARARVEFDLNYVHQFSILLDLRILWLTLVELGKPNSGPTGHQGEDQ
jgi:lipopolysaccharide/colanic/teichoic acid biosynthesis glycosyltransferase